MTRVKKIMITKGMMTSNTPEWETPQELFDELDREFEFNLDVCAKPENAKCIDYFDPETDGLKQSWEEHKCWMNPPYGREIGKWVKKASEIKVGFVVALLPARTDTRWFHDYIYNKAEIRFLRGRVKFLGKTNKKENIGKLGAPFPSMIVIFK